MNLAQQCSSQTMYVHVLVFARADDDINNGQETQTIALSYY